MAARRGLLILLVLLPAATAAAGDRPVAPNRRVQGSFAAIDADIQRQHEQRFEAISREAGEVMKSVCIGCAESPPAPAKAPPRARAKRK
jgi:hypothetical protein